MAKGKSYKAVPQVKERTNGNAGKPRTKIVELSTGTKLKLVGLNQMKANAINSSVKYPDPPTYAAPIGEDGEEMEYYPIDETVLQDKSLTPEELKDYTRRWNKYQADYAKAEDDRREKGTRYMLTTGIVFDMPEDDSWIEEWEFLGINVPDNLIERRYRYLTTEVITTPEDLSMVLIEIMDLTGVSEEARQSAMDSFQAAMDERLENMDTTGEAEDTEKPVAAK